MGRRSTRHRVYLAVAVFELDVAHFKRRKVVLVAVVEAPDGRHGDDFSIAIDSVGSRFLGLRALHFAPGDTSDFTVERIVRTLTDQIQAEVGLPSRGIATSRLVAKVASHDVWLLRCGRSDLYLVNCSGRLICKDDRAARHGLGSGCAGPPGRGSLDRTAAGQQTTLAHQIAADSGKAALYLDLEAREDRTKLSGPALFLRACEDRLVILDEIHRAPELFATLRGLIDQGRRRGLRHGCFLILGSASIDLLRQSGASLAGRIAYVGMGPIDALEAAATGAALSTLWVRGGFRDSYLAGSDAESLAIRDDFIRTYLERDVPQFGPRVPAETLQRLWTMLAHSQGTLLNASRLAAGLSISAPAITRYVDLLVDLLLVRRLPPLRANNWQAVGEVAQSVRARQRSAPCPARDPRLQRALRAPGRGHELGRLCRRDPAGGSATAYPG